MAMDMKEAADEVEAARPNDGGSAFPQTESYHGEVGFIASGDKGMSLRAYLAAHAPEPDASTINGIASFPTHVGIGASYEDRLAYLNEMAEAIAVARAKWATIYADALLAELAKD